MRISNVIRAHLHDHSVGQLPGSDEFLSRYKKYLEPRTRAFYFPDEEIARDAILFLDKNKLRWTRSYAFHLQDEELETYPAVYFGVEDVVDAIKQEVVDVSLLKKRDIAVDYRTLRLIVSPWLARLLEPVTKNVDWSPIECSTGNEWLIMTAQATLPDPIFVPLPIDIDEYEDPAGTYSIRSDGRDVISTKSSKSLSAVGLATCAEVKTPNGEFRCHPRIVATGRVMFALRNAGVQGLFDTIVPLLHESHPLADTTLVST